MLYLVSDERDTSVHVSIEDHCPIGFTECEEETVNLLSIGINREHFLDLYYYNTPATLLR